MWKFPSYQVDKGVDWDYLYNTYDWVRDMEKTPQDAIWHAEGNVLIHTQMVVEVLQKLEEFQSLSDQDKHILITSAVLHDVEKRITTTTEIRDGVERIVSPRHAKRGEFTARQFLYKDIETPFHIRETISKMVRHHGLPIWSIYKPNPQKTAILSSLGLNTAHLAMLSKADVLGRECDDSEEMLLRISLFEELCKENECFGKVRNFKSNYERFLYLNQNKPLGYVPFDDLEFEVVVLSALPGTGKDYYAANNLGLPVLSLDDIRRENKISPIDKRGNGRVIQMGKEKAKEYLRRKESFVYNATNITKDMRDKWISLFLSYNARVRIVYLEVPYDTLKKQNMDREYPIHEDVIESLLQKLEIPSYDEAHEIEYVLN